VFVDKYEFGSLNVQSNNKLNIMYYNNKQRAYNGWFHELPLAKFAIVSKYSEVIDNVLVLLNCFGCIIEK